MKLFINYSDDKFKKQQQFALFMAKHAGGFDKVIGYNKEDIEEKFYNKYVDILLQPKGGGYWLWKPYFIAKTLEQLAAGDYLFYLDSGAFFLKNAAVLMQELDKTDQDIMGFELPLIEGQWTKKELFINMNCDAPGFAASNQILASFMLIKKTKMSTQFCQEYLAFSCDEIKLTDSPSTGIQQKDDFISHRNDQSIFSLLYKKYNLHPFKDPSQFGKYPVGYLDGIKGEVEHNKLKTTKSGRKYRIPDYAEPYSMLIFHHRHSGSTNSLIKYIRFRVKELLFKVGIIKRPI